MHAAISPDGKYVANTVTDAGGSSVWIKHVDAAEATCGIAGPEVTEYVSVRFSPDGRSVYYIALDHDKGESTLYRVPAWGASSVVAGNIYPIAFSPEGNRIAFMRTSPRRSEVTS